MLFRSSYLGERDAECDFLADVEASRSRIAHILSCMCDTVDITIPRTPLAAWHSGLARGSYAEGLGFNPERAQFTSMPRLMDGAAWRGQPALALPPCWVAR